jgi:hypothetical protein
VTYFDLFRKHLDDIFSFDQDHLFLSKEDDRVKILRCTELSRLIKKVLRAVRVEGLALYNLF